MKLPEGLDEGDAVTTQVSISSPSPQTIGLIQGQRRCETSQLFMTVFSYPCTIGPPVCGGAVDVSSVPEQLYDELNRNGIHQLENIITLEMSIRMAFDALSLWFKPVAVCLIFLLCTLIEVCYRALLIHTKSILYLVLEGYQSGQYPRRSPSPQQMRDFQSLRNTILNYVHCAVR